MGLFQSDVFSVKQLFGNQRPNKYFSNCFAKWFRRVFLNEFLKLLREVISTFQQYFRTITNRKRLNCLKYRYNFQRSYSKTLNKIQWKKYYERFYFSKVTGRRLRNVSGKFFSTKKKHSSKHGTVANSVRMHGKANTHQSTFHTNFGQTSLLLNSCRKIQTGASKTNKKDETWKICALQKVCS